jgi:hypothetical protein
MSDTGDQERNNSHGHGDRYERNRNGYIPKSIQEALIIAALFGLVGAWWTFGKAIAVLQTMQESQQRQIDKIDRRQDTLEGRIARGGPDAIDQQ